MSSCVLVTVMTSGVEYVFMSSFREQPCVVLCPFLNCIGCFLLLRLLVADLVQRLILCRTGSLQIHFLYSVGYSFALMIVFLDV